MEEKKAASLGLTFESLCRFFSNKDASGLLGLPDTVTEVHSFLFARDKLHCFGILKEWCAFFSFPLLSISFVDMLTKTRFDLA